jgi:hypothetical protein
MGTSQTRELGLLFRPPVIAALVVHLMLQQLHMQCAPSLMHNRVAHSSIFPLHTILRTLPLPTYPPAHACANQPLLCRTYLLLVEQSVPLARTSRASTLAPSINAH